MFNTPRFHRWLTVPTTLIMVFALVTSEAPQWTIGLMPAFGLLPLVAVAAHARPHGTAHRRAVNATRWAVWVALIWACVLVLLMGPFGVLSTIAVVPALVAIGRDPTEERMAVVTVWLGVVGLLATYPLAFFGVAHMTWMTASVLLITGGTVWLIEVNVANREVAPLPRAVTT